MLQNGVGFTFQEKMSGGFSLTETDPQTGAEAGEKLGQTLTMHATIHIPDLNAFFADDEHPGTLTGKIDYELLGFDLPSTSGVFKLFSPTDQPELKYMVYELGFEVKGRPYYFAGHKDVKQAAVTKSWKATTTLYSQLHDGADTNAPVIGAGVLTLGVTDLMAMIPTMHATNAPNTEQAMEAVAKFGQFFTGELWDTYVKRAGGATG